MSRSGSSLSVALVIVTFRREQKLLENLRMIVEAGFKFDEIVIVDNGRSEQLLTEGRSLRDTVKVIQPEKNLGACGRTIGILATHSDIVITLDDDVTLDRPEQMDYLRSLFSAHDRIGCVNFRILHAVGKDTDLSDWCHPRDPAADANWLFETTYISEGACAFRGSLVREIGAYPLDLFIGQEGVELAARILDAGFGIYYLPSVRTYHSIGSRDTGRQFYFNSRNIFVIAVRTYPVSLAIETVLREWSTLLLFSLLRGRVGFFLRGCRDALSSGYRALADRRPIAVASARRIRYLNRQKPSVWRRCMRLRQSKTLD